MPLRLARKAKRFLIAAFASAAMMAGAGASSSPDKTPFDPQEQHLAPADGTRLVLPIKPYQDFRK